MREPAAPLRLEPEPNLVVHAYGHDRRRRIRRDHYIQPVRQLRVLDCNLKSIHPFPPIETTFFVWLVREAECEPLCPTNDAASRVSTSSPSRGRILSASLFNASYALQYSGE